MCECTLLSLAEVLVCWEKEQIAALGAPHSRKGAHGFLQIKARSLAAQPLRVLAQGDKAWTKCKVQPPRVQV